MALARMTVVDSKKLLLSKWTAVEPRDNEKHFVVRRVLKKRAKETKRVCVEIEAVISKRVRMLSLLELGDTARWARGWTRDSHMG